MSVKLQIDFDSEEDVDILCEILLAAKHGRRESIIDSTTQCKLVQVSVIAVTQPDTSIVIYDPVAVANGQQQSNFMSVNLYELDPNQTPFSFGGSQVTQTLVIPRLQAVSAQQAIPTVPTPLSSPHIIQTLGVTTTPRLAVTTSPQYFTTFTAATVVGQNPYVFRFAMPGMSATPPATPPNGATTLSAPNCVVEDVVGNGQRVLQVTYPNTTISNYYLWRKICTGSPCDQDFQPQGTAQPFFPTVEDLFIQITFN